MGRTAVRRPARERRRNGHTARHGAFHVLALDSGGGYWAIDQSQKFHQIPIWFGMYSTPETVSL